MLKYHNFVSVCMGAAPSDPHISDCLLGQTSYRIPLLKSLLIELVKFLFNMLSSLENQMSPSNSALGADSAGVQPIITQTT